MDPAFTDVVMPDVTGSNYPSCSGLLESNVHFQQSDKLVLTICRDLFCLLCLGTSWDVTEPVRLGNWKQNNTAFLQNNMVQFVCLYFDYRRLEMAPNYFIIPISFSLFLGPVHEGAATATNYAFH